MLLLPTPVFLALDAHAGAISCSSDETCTYFPSSGGKTQAYAGGELAIRVGRGFVDPGLGFVARVGVAPGAGPVELGGWADARVFLRSGLEVGAGPMIAVGAIGYSDGGYIPGALVTLLGGPSVSSRWGPGLRGGVQLRGAYFFSLGAELTHLLGQRTDTVPITALPTFTASMEALLLPAYTVGRPLRVPGGYVLARGLRGLRGEAREWYDQARGEQASVPAFLRLARELAATGAPRSLVRAAVEEAGHAELCLRIASGRAGRRLSLGAVPAPPPRRARRETLAAEALVDGVGGEAAGARDAAVAADATRRADEGRAWTIIAREEARHAVLGEAIVDWAG